MDDQQRARELWSDALRNVGQHEYAYHVGCGGDLNPSEQATLDAITAALRAAPDAELHAAAEDFYNTVATQAAANDLQKSVSSWGLVVAAGARLHLALHNQNGVAVLAHGSQVVPPPALGAHEVHPEAVDAGLDLGKSSERLVAADALEHAASVSAECDGSATVPEGFVLVKASALDGIRTAAEACWAQSQDKSFAEWVRDDAKGQARGLRAALSMLSARPQGVKGE